MGWLREWWNARGIADRSAPEPSITGNRQLPTDGGWSGIKIAKWLLGFLAGFVPSILIIGLIIVIAHDAGWRLVPKSPAWIIIPFLFGVYGARRFGSTDILERAIVYIRNIKLTFLATAIRDSLLFRRFVAGTGAWMGSMLIVDLAFDPFGGYGHNALLAKWMLIPPVLVFIAIIAFLWANKRTWP